MLDGPEPGAAAAAAMEPEKREAGGRALALGVWVLGRCMTKLLLQG
jgi:hypothetical protein